MYAVDPAPLGDHLRHRRGGAVQRRIARRVERDAAGAAPEAVQVLQAQPAGLQAEGVLDHAPPPESCIYNLRRLFSTLRPAPDEAACAAAAAGPALLLRDARPGAPPPPLPRSQHQEERLE